MSMVVTLFGFHFSNSWVANNRVDLIWTEASQLRVLNTGTESRLKGLVIGISEQVDAIANAMREIFPVAILAY
jgi:hypothetical protein